MLVRSVAVCRTSCTEALLLLLLVHLHFMRIVSADLGADSIPPHGILKAVPRVSGRRLQLDVNALDSSWQWPSRATLTVGTVAASQIQIECQVSLTYSKLRIEAPMSASFGSQHDLARVKLVTAGASRLNCSSSAFDAPMDLVPSGAGTVLSDMAKGHPMAVSNANFWALAAADKQIRFMHGGFFQLCYAPDGTFLELDSDLYNNVLPAIIRVVGVSSNCSTNGCLSQEQWHCHFTYRGASQPTCVLSLSGSDAPAGWSITAGATSRASWTSAWVADTTSNGMFLAENPSDCTGSDPEAAKLQEAILDTSFFGLDVSSNRLTLPKVKSSTASSFTVSVCYCPNYFEIGSNPCVRRQDFIQNFGRLHFWSIALCDISQYDPGCTARYLSVMPQQAFRVHVLCPPGQACAAGAGLNELRLIAASTGPVLQSWQPANPCQVNTTVIFWASTSRGLYGGTRTDYKDFHSVEPPRIDQSLGSELDVCYCDSECDIASHWLPVGKLKTVQAIAFASVTGPDVGGTNAIRYVGKPGGLALYGGVSSEDSMTTDPYDAPLFSNSAVMNFLSFDRLTAPNGKTLEQGLGAHISNLPSFQASMDAECQREIYQGVVTGFSSREEAAEYIAMPSASSPQFLAFDGVEHNMTMTALNSGVLAACYCGTVDEVAGTCQDLSHWLFVGRVTIRGPRGDQVWDVTRNLIFSLAVEGWGLEGTDRLRIVGADEDCDVSNSSGLEGLRTGCPSIDGSGCKTVDPFYEITLLADGATSVSATLYLKSVSTTDTKTYLSFNGPLTGRLSDGDMISLSLSTLLVGGVAQASWTRTDAFNAQRLAGILEFPDNATDASAPPQTHLLAHRVTLVPGSSDQVTIPVGWPTDPGFSFVQESGLWSKHNEVLTAEEIKSTMLQSSLAVCWSANDQGLRHYALAGQLNIIEAPSMSSAKVSLTTKQRGTVAPVVISFQTSSTAKHASAKGATLLKLFFLDVGDGSGGNSGMLVPKKAGDWDPSGSPPGDFSTSVSVLPGAAFQSVCGQFIMELWSNDEAGFPMPRGCYFGKSYRDEGSSTYWREFVIKFEPGNGLRHECRQGGSLTTCEYHIVMNAAVVSAVQDDNLVDIFSMCPECHNPFSALERGRALLGTTPVDAAGASDPQLSPTSLQLLGADTSGIVTLSGTSPLLKVRVSSTSTLSQQITGGSLLRLYLWPLTAWDVVNTTCSATCEAYEPGYACGPAVSCLMEGVVDADVHQNVVKLALPSNMDPITGLVAHSIYITQLQLPQGGWFPTRIAAQLTDATDSRPSYTTSGSFILKMPSLGTTSATLVANGRTNQGSKPFANEQGNSIIVRLLLGATLWQSGDNTAVKIRLSYPRGYVCSQTVNTVGADGGSGDVDPAHPIFNLDLDADGYQDHLQTTLGTNSLEGAWSTFHQGSCDYVFAKNMILFAGTALVMRLAVNNPSTALSKDAATNLWQLEVFGKGFSPSASPWIIGAIDFTSPSQMSGSDMYASNLAVVTPLLASQQSLQPTDFGRGAVQKVQVFFRPHVSTGPQGFVVVDAPGGFDFSFSGVCRALDLDSKYYVIPSIPTPATQRLQSIASCTPLQWQTGTGFNRARIQVTRGLQRLTWYGFALETQNPFEYTTSMQTQGWLLWTQDIHGTAVEGSHEGSPVRMNPAASTRFESWGIFNSSMSGVQVLFPNNAARPTSMTGAATTVRFSNITVPVSGTYVLRVAAPHGFTFEKDSSNLAFDFVGYASGTSTFPTTPSVQHSSELIWGPMLFSSGEIYGFEVQMRIPDKPTTTSSYAFFSEFGYSASGLPARLQAGLVKAPVLQSLLNCAVDYIGNVAGYAQNYLQFTVETATILPQGGGIIISTTTDGFQLSCLALAMGAANQLPSGTGCMVATSPTKVTLTAGRQGILAGLYHFDLLASNPPSPLSAGTWTFESFEDVSIANPTLPVDKASTVAGFAVRRAMGDARLASLTQAQLWMNGRNDRPLQANSLVFELEFGGGLQPRGDLQLRGPAGFTFHEDCLFSVVTDLSVLFGPNSSNRTSNYTLWPSYAAPSACTGYGSLAFLSLGSGLIGTNRYVFRIGVKENPNLTPMHNLWSMEFAGKSSIPFAGSSIWTFTSTEVRPSSRSQFISETDVLPVGVHFRPQNKVPAQTGLLVLTAPPGFTFAGNLSDGTCSVSLAAILPQENVIYDASELACSLVSSTMLTLRIIGLRPLGAGQLHSLTARVSNPGEITDAKTWRLQSFSKSPQLDENALDDVVAVVGFATTQALPQWTVSNVDNVVKGAHAVEVHFSLAPGTAPLKSDKFAITAPSGFQLDSDGGGCSGFQWIGNVMNDTLVSCPCNFESSTGCRLLLETNATYSQNTVFLFKVSGHNPSNMPLLVENVWQAQHWRSGNQLSTRTVASWQILPQLSSLGISLVGNLKAAGSISEIQVEFVAVNTAGAVSITAVSPFGFEFDNSTVVMPHTIDLNHTNGSTIVVNAQIHAGQLTTVLISGVRLSPTGGETVFSLTTMRNSASGLAAKRDELLGFQGGFRLPGRTSVLSATFISQYAKAPQQYPLRSGFLPRVGERGWAQFMLTFSQPVESGHVVKISSAGHALHQLDAVDFALTDSNNVSLKLNITQQGQYVLKVISLQRLVAGATYHVKFWATPLLSGQSFWRFETEDVESPEYPTNTNDGDVVDFKPVQQIIFTATTLRAPPSAPVTVTLSFPSGTDQLGGVHLLGPLVLVAPETFLFTPSSCGPNCTSTPSGFFPGTLRQSTKLTGSGLGAPFLNVPLQIQVQLPIDTPSDTVWLLQGFRIDGTMAAWGAVTGFPLEPMRGVSVFYNALLGSRNTRVVVTFETRVPGGTEIFLQAPLQYGLFCRTPDALKQLALPGQRPRCLDNFGSQDPKLVRKLNLVLNGTTLDRGEYAFGVICDLPTNPTAAAAVGGIDGTWSLAVLGSGGVIVESIYSIPPLPISSAGLSTPILTWSKSEADQPSFITLGFSVEQPITGVRAVLFVFPSRVLHNVHSSSDLQVAGLGFPYVSSTEGLLLSQMSMLRLSVIENSTIPIGIFRFQFPVIIPWEMPSQNLWHLALCRTASCLKPDDPDVIVSFVLAGFNIGERGAALEGQAPTSGTTPGQALQLSAAAWFTLVFLPLLMVPS